MTTVSNLDQLVSQAQDKLNEHTLEYVHLHFSPETGSPPSTPSSPPIVRKWHSKVLHGAALNDACAIEGTATARREKLSEIVDGVIFHPVSRT